jgi:hypothetical protein
MQISSIFIVVHEHRLCFHTCKEEEKKRKVIYLLLLRIITVEVCVHTNTQILHHLFYLHTLE